MKSYADHLPKLPGLLPSLTKFEKRRVCKRILALQAQGKSPAEAKKIAAGEFGIDSQMVHRIWRMRAELLAEEPPEDHE